MEPDPGDLTIATYEQIAEAYADRDRTRPDAVVAHLARFAAASGGPGALVLEIGSGPGEDADLLSSAGLTVLRTDATPAFVARLRAAGHDARRLDVRRDPLGGPYDGVVASAVLLHLTATEFTRAIGHVHAALRPGGAFGLTLKEGDGAELTTSKVGRPRWFTYWREDPLRAQLAAAGFAVEHLEHVAGTHEDWLHVIARR